jgi:hypothetical protein
MIRTQTNSARRARLFQLRFLRKSVRFCACGKVLHTICGGLPEQNRNPLADTLRTLADSFAVFAYQFEAHRMYAAAHIPRQRRLSVRFWKNCPPRNAF